MPCEEGSTDSYRHAGAVCTGPLNSYPYGEQLFYAVQTQALLNSNRKAGAVHQTEWYGCRGRWSAKVRPRSLRGSNPLTRNPMGGWEEKSTASGDTGASSGGMFGLGPMATEHIHRVWDMRSHKHIHALCIIQRLTGTCTLV